MDVQSCKELLLFVVVVVILFMFFFRDKTAHLIDLRHERFDFKTKYLGWWGEETIKITH